MRLRRLMLFIVLAVVSVVGTMAQGNNFSYKVIGEVADSINGKGEPYATIGIYRQGEESGKPVAMAVTDINGKFFVGS